MCEHTFAPLHTWTHIWQPNVPTHVCVLNVEAEKESQVLDESKLSSRIMKYTIYYETLFIMIYYSLWYNLSMQSLLKGYFSIKTCWFLEWF